MKIEMCESLMYSWMKHVKDCQIVQTNWKISSQWTMNHQNDIREYMDFFSDLFKKRFDVFKKNVSVEQVINQGECDVIGISINDKEQKVYAADVAFHRYGLNYANTVQKVTEKLIRTAFCIYGYTSLKEAEIIFASPFVGKSNLEEISECMNNIQKNFDELGFNYRFRFIANDDFRDEILHPICLTSKYVEDMGELFMRAYQLVEMFYSTCPKQQKKKRTSSNISTMTANCSDKSMDEFKVGKLARIYFEKFAAEGQISQEINNLLDADYSKTTFGLNYPCLVKEDTSFDKLRYYSNAIDINGEKYYLCSQWFETPANNDRPLLVEWIKGHLKASDQD